MEKSLEDALKLVLTLGDSGYKDYAKAYANAALKSPVTGVEMEGEELEVQVRYVLSNLGYWKGYQAQVTKDIFKKFLGIKVDKHGK
jgi:hypothetical protein